MSASQTATSISVSQPQTSKTQHRGPSTTNKQMEQVRRRNERERKRVHQVNLGYELLSRKVPLAKSKKLSKVETLRYAVQYIRYLQRLLGTDTISSISFTPSESTPNNEFLKEMQLIHFTSSCPHYTMSSDQIYSSPIYGPVSSSSRS